MGTSSVVLPDIEIHPTIQGIRNGKDEVLNYALSTLHCDLTSTSELDNSSQISIYPNPATHSFQYMITGISTGQNIIFQIYDMQGRIIKITEKKSLSGVIEISALKSGLYILKIISNEMILSKPIIKQ